MQLQRILGSTSRVVFNTLEDNEFYGMRIRNLVISICFPLPHTHLKLSIRSSLRDKCRKHWSHISRTKKIKKGGGGIRDDLVSWVHPYQRGIFVDMALNRAHKIDSWTDDGVN